MPLKAELNAVKKNYVKLMKLPVKDLLPALKVVFVCVCLCVCVCVCAHARMHVSVCGCLSVGVARYSECDYCHRGNSVIC